MNSQSKSEPVRNRKPSADQKLHGRIRSRMSAAVWLAYGAADRADYRLMRQLAERAS